MVRKKTNESISLYKYIWQSYIRTALIPLTIIESIFICIYFGLFTWSQSNNVNLLKEQTQSELQHIVAQECNSINYKLSSITNSVMLFSNQITQALSKNTQLTPEDSKRLTYSREGNLYTKENANDSCVSIFYSPIISTKEQQLQKVSKVLTIQNLMADIKNTEPLATSVYFNSFDSLNITYPYSNPISKFNSSFNAASYNFYYEADAEHNPEKKVKWTNAYVDTINNGLVTSVIYPVYNNSNFLEGVVGIEMTLDTIANQVLTMEIPWQGYGVLIDKDGNILSFSNRSESDLGLNTNNNSKTDLKDKFNTDEFNLYKNPIFYHLSRLLSKQNL